MLEGMRADFDAIDALSQRLVERARRAERDHLPDAGRNRFRSRVFPETEMAQDQRHHHARKNGATCPGAKFSLRPSNSNGIFVVDGVVGDYLCQKYGDIAGDARSRSR